MAHTATDSGFDNAINQLPCNWVNNFTTGWEQCSYVIQNECLEEDALDYVYFNYCKMGPKLMYVSIALITSLLLVFFVTLSSIADEFLCPSLLTIAKNLRMSENLAGVTLLAFGNGCSDIFTSLAGASGGKSELIISELLGAGIICLSIVAGLIFIKQDFRLAYRPLLRDTIFYLFAVYLTWFVCWGQQITFYYASAFILIYVIYLTVALGGQAIYLHIQQKQKQQQQSSIECKVPSISVKINNTSKDNNNNNSSQDSIDNKKTHSSKQEDDWSYGSDWFVQSHDSMRRRRLSKVKVMTQEERALLQGSAAKFGEPKYGGTNKNNATLIKVEYDAMKNSNKNVGNKPEVDYSNRRTSTSNTMKYLDVVECGDSKSIGGLEMKLIMNTNQVNRKPIDSPTFDGFVNPSFSDRQDCITQMENLIKPPIEQHKGLQSANNIDNKYENLNSDNTNQFHVMLDRRDMSKDPYKNSPDNADMMNSFPPEGGSLDCKCSNGDCLKSEMRNPDRGDDDDDYDRNSISLNEWDDLLAHVNPIYLGEWYEAGVIRRIITIIRSPLILIALCTIPVVDHDKKRNNWCRLLNTFHCISIPIVIFLTRELGSSSSSDASLAKSTSWTINGFDLGTLAIHYYPLLLIVIGLTCAIYILKTSQSDRPPKYHVLFAYVGFVMSIIWVYTLVTEILGLLKTIGIIFNMSDTIIGLTFLAWGNSLGDIVANLALAEAGYPRMAIGACIGAPLLNLLFGFGLAFVVNLRPNELVVIEYTPTITLLCSTLGIVILSLMLCTLVPPNYSKRPFGYVLISAYFIYILLAISLEFNWII